ncbi:MAG: AAA family ATPase [Geminicoccaceae bacterium]|nr:AAA family ATPase [Geminicoccaceae bacterium]
MARSDLLVSLVRAGTSGDRRLMKSTVEAIIAEERSKQHNVLAEKLTKAMNGMGNGVHQLQAVPVEPAHRGRDFIAEVQPQRRLEELVLPDLVRTACSQLIEEHHRANVLRSHSLEPRHRVLLVGPPGNGKTTLAEAVAEALALPLYVVRYELMIGSYLGETASRLKRLFDYVRTTPCVLFFDEFDVLGKERGDTHETGEIKRVVSSLLLQIDDLPSYAIVMAATNHAELLDRAVWRRFQIRMELPRPTQKQMAAFITTFLARLDEPAGMTAETLAKRLGPVSYSEAEQFCLDLFRQQVLAMGERPLKTIVAEQLKLWAARVSASQPQDEGLSRAGTSAPENPGT